MSVQPPAPPCDRVRIPNNWTPRPYQRAVWMYLAQGGKRASLMWHRRAGKDDICLHWTAVAALERAGNYWHMLPEAAQARKAIWTAINPHTGVRRIDEVFPPSIRAGSPNEQDMSLRLVSGSTWQVVGSDNYRSLVGAPPVGLVFSEWAKASPQAWAYLAPILLENDGWAIFPSTPEGRNHAYRTYTAYSADPTAFAEILRADDTGVFTAEQLAAERQSMCDIYGETLGAALYAQEYECSVEAAVLGAVYAREIAEIRATGRVCDVPLAAAPVYTAWDLGRTDATAIFWWQFVGGEVRVLEYEEANLETVHYYSERITGRRILNDIADWGYGHRDPVWGDTIPEIAHRRAYNYAQHYLPHDAKHKTLAASGVSIEQMLRKALRQVTVLETAAMSLPMQRAACRTALRRAWFSRAAAESLDTLAGYKFAYNEERRTLSDTPIHDWTSHCADAWRTLAVALPGVLTAAMDRPAYERSRKRSRTGSAWAA